MGRGRPNELIQLLKTPASVLWWLPAVGGARATYRDLATFDPEFERCHSRCRLAEADDTSSSWRQEGDKKRDKKAWASQDRSPPDRAARSFCFGLKRIFKNDWNIPYIVQISDEAPYKMTVGGEDAVTVHIEGNGVRYEWNGEWKTLDELHDNPKVKELIQKNADMLSRAGQGMKGGGGLAQGSAKGR